MHILKCDVYQAAMRRLDYIFKEFDNVYVSFSGGKDSGVLLHLVLKYIEENKLAIKPGLFHIDYEAQYSKTTEYVDHIYSSLTDRVIPLRCCVPVKVPTCTSMHQNYWRPWEEEKRDIWVRSMPEHCLTKSDFDFITEDSTDYDFQMQFATWYHQRQSAKKTCALVGIRASESLHRWRTIVSDRNINKYKNIPWTTRINKNVYNAYPVYDWKTEDIWLANGKFSWPYNELYDLFYISGVPPGAMRVASPFLQPAKSSLTLYRTIDPDVWSRLVSRVNGVNFTAIYGGTTAMGWKSITKPPHFTWQEYASFLLDTLPKETADGYRAKLATSIKFWLEKGGVLSEETIADLQRAGVDFRIGEKTNYKTDKLPVKLEYLDDIDTKEFSSVPTWKRLCVCIMKNDHIGQYMGFSRNKAEVEKRRIALEKYKDL